jgi:purine-binding chemotaxis protein CheW
VDIGDVAAGLIVDNVAEVISIEDGNIVPPVESGGMSNAYLMGIGKVGDEVKLLLDCEKLFLENEL